MLPPLFAYAVCLFHITPCRVFSYRISEKRFKGHLHHNYFICFHRPQTLCKSFYDYSSCHYLCIPLYKIMNVVSRLFLFLSVFSVLLSSNMLLFYFRLRLSACDVHLKIASPVFPQPVDNLFHRGDDPASSVRGNHFRQ